jgi:cytosine/adenosine deaminase-related metal-dependent hydrolase
MGGAGDGRQRRSIEGGGAAVSGSRIEFVGTTFDGGIERESEVGSVLIAPGLIDPDALVALIRPCRVSTIKRITSAFQSFA